MSSILELTFVNELNRTRSLRVHDVKSDVSDAEVAAVMSNVINKNIFNSAGGDLIGKARARVITTSSSTIALA